MIEICLRTCISMIFAKPLRHAGRVGEGQLDIVRPDALAAIFGQEDVEVGPQRVGIGREVRGLIEIGGRNVGAAHAVEQIAPRDQRIDLDRRRGRVFR